MPKLKQILVIDDDAAMATLLKDFLGKQGYTVATSSSVASAQSWLKSLPAGQSPDLIISDVKLGTASGIDFAKQLRTERPSLPVILFSVFEGHEKEALKVGARKFLRKPFPLSALAAILKDEFRKK